METKADERARDIESRLHAALEPTVLTVRDESEKHRGHAGAASGGGHFRVTIVSPRFDACSRLERHRLCYAALGDAFASEVHALAIRAFTPEEWERKAASD